MLRVRTVTRLLVTLTMVLGACADGDTPGETEHVDTVTTDGGPTTGGADSAPPASDDDGTAPSTADSSGTSSEGDDAIVSSDVSAPGADASPSRDHLAHSYTHKMRKPTGENLFASLAYECSQCTVEQHAAIEVPEGWTKGPVQQILSDGELRSTPSFEGVPDAMDFVEEVPGNEYILIAKNLDGEILETGENGVVVRAQVMRDTVLRFPTDSRVHELTDPEGDVYVLFAHGVDPDALDDIDFQAVDALGDFSGPEGWTYTTRVLDDELALDTPDIATVLAIRGETTSTWEKR